MFKCIKCKKEKPPTAFPINRTRKSGYHSCCKDCKKIYNSKHYLENKSYYLSKAKRNSSLQILKLRSIVNALKNRPCTDCKRIFPSIAMDFDHISGNKIANISTLVSRGTEETLRNELIKCELVCACCHRIRTGNRRSILVRTDVGEPN